MSTLNQDIVKYARDNVGKRVYKENDSSNPGECWALAFEAIRTNGGKTPFDYGSDPYVWSSKVVQPENAIAGDILQFSNYKFKIEIEDAEGFLEGEYILGVPRHTSILKGKGQVGDWDVYEQNMNNNKNTAVNQYYMIPGTYEHGGRKVKITRVTGSFKIYRAIK